jgi:lysine/ornithine N-monooxygenase
MSLFHFARARLACPHEQFAGPYRTQPSVALFHTHVQWLCEHYQLTGLRVRGWAKGVTFCQGGVRVETTRGSLKARQVLFAIGPSEPLWPAWARTLQGAGAPIAHVFDSHFDRQVLPAWTQAVVIGGGITAVQTALALAWRAPGTVTLLSRHALREHAFDSDLCWFSTCLSAYQREANLARRRAIIQKARNRGSVPPDILAEFNNAVCRGLLTLRNAEVITVVLTPEGKLCLSCSSEEEPIVTDQVVLATGFEQERPGGKWLTRVIEDLGLACSACGYPILDRSLCWQDRIYVTGALAELEIGPVARNIMGVRLAAERIAAAL